VSVLLWLVIINVAVFLHELAHYGAARVQGVAVKAFSLGMGPILWRRTWQGTEWRLSLLPFGGYVDIDGLAPQPDEDGNLLPPTSGMAKLGFWGKFLILFAGPLSNVILAIALASAVLVGQGLPENIPSQVRIEQVVAGSTAERQGVRVNDLIVAINERPFGDYRDLQASLKSDGPRSYTIERQNGSKSQRLTLRFDWSPKPATGPTRPKFGIALANDVRYLPVALPDAVVRSTSTLLGGVPEMIAAFGSGVARVFSFQPVDKTNMSEPVGPVGTVSVVGQVAEAGFWPLMMLASIINLSLGIFNLLPIPGLDGGRIVLSAVQALRRKPFAPGQEEFINFLGFAFVMVFIVLVTFRDIIRLGS
jgi:regulator of sigma E protease